MVACHLSTDFTAPYCPERVVQADDDKSHQIVPPQKHPSQIKLVAIIISSRAVSARGPSPREYGIAPLTARRWVAKLLPTRYPGTSRVIRSV